MFVVVLHLSCVFAIKTPGEVALTKLKHFSGCATLAIRNAYVHGVRRTDTVPISYKFKGVTLITKPFKNV